MEGDQRPKYRTSYLKPSRAFFPLFLFGLIDRPRSSKRPGCFAMNLNPNRSERGIRMHRMANKKGMRAVLVVCTVFYLALVGNSRAQDPVVEVDGKLNFGMDIFEIPELVSVLTSGWLQLTYRHGQDGGSFGPGWFSRFDQRLTRLSADTFALAQQSGTRYFRRTTTPGNSPDGGELYLGDGHEGERLVALAGGYSLSSGKWLETFGRDGRLARIGERGGSSGAMVAYDQPRTTRMTNHRGHAVLFLHDAAGRVRAVENDGLVLAAFDYDSAGRLQSVNTQLARYCCAYDQGGRLAEIRANCGQPGEKVLVAVEWQEDRVGALRYGTVDRRYTYAEEADGDGGLTLNRRDTDATAEGDNPGRTIRSRWRRGIEGQLLPVETENNDGKSIEVAIFDQRCGRPASIRRGIQEAKFTFDEACRLQRKDTLNALFTFTYDQRGLLREQQTTDHLTGRTTIQRIERDAQGRMVLFIDADGERISFTENPASRSTRVVSSRGWQGEILQDAKGRWQRISLTRTDTLIIHYDGISAHEETDFPCGVEPGFKPLVERLRGIDRVEHPEIALE